MRLNQFQYLLSLAEHGSFSKAAQELFVAQPSISQAIKEMEEELGILILRRSKCNNTVGNTNSINIFYSDPIAITKAYCCHWCIRTIGADFIWTIGHAVPSCCDGNFLIPNQFAE